MKIPCSINRLQSVELQGSSPILFISDLHLSKTLPNTCIAFYKFVNNISPKTQALFILGDLFEYWVGDDCLNEVDEFIHTVIRHLFKLHQLGISVYVLPGNRDFLLGQKFVKHTHTILLDDICVLSAFQKKIVLAHGDSLCTDDHRYQSYRYWVHQSWLQYLFLATPLLWRQKIAQQLRQRSQKQYKNLSLPSWQDVNTQVAQHILQTHQSTILIHGHTHQPQCHILDNGTRWVLSDWDMDNAQRASYLCLDHTGLYPITLS